ncbi:hypothetical protein KR059_011840 [Drosophila kikkawai]|nr:hypothetical protein KR059_011840 [Drosophila kikkawai]
MFWFPLIVCFFLGLKPGMLQFLESNCGRMDSRALQNTNSLAHIHEGPWMAYLHAGGKFHCGGSLINHRYVLTAYHCIQHGETLSVRLGEYNTATYNDCNGNDCIPPYEEFQIDKAIRNKDYTRNNRFHDIALIRLSRWVEYKAHIKPICLITDKSLHSYIESMQDFKATGWGSRTRGSPSRTLKSIPIHRLDRSECRNRYMVECGSGQICVDHEPGVACGGDSGGPMGHMVRLEDQTVYVQVGIVSYGNPECRSPSVFTDVMSHIDWIQMVIRRFP